MGSAREAQRGPQLGSVSRILPGRARAGWVSVATWGIRGVVNSGTKGHLGGGAP